MFLVLVFITALGGSPSESPPTAPRYSKRARPAGDYGDVSPDGSPSSAPVDRLSGVEKRAEAKWGAASSESPTFLWIPRVLLWPVRAVFTLVTTPTLSVVEWAEASGLAGWVKRTARSPEGTFFPIFSWRSRKRARGGVRVGVPFDWGGGRKMKLRAAGWGGHGVWGGRAGGSFWVLKKLGLYLDAGVFFRDDRWLRLPRLPSVEGRGQAVRFVQRHARAGLSGRWRFSKWAALDLGVFYTNDAVGPRPGAGGVGDVIDDGSRGAEEEFRPRQALPWAPHRVAGLQIRVGLVVGPWARRAWRGSSGGLRRRTGPGAALSATYFHSLLKADLRSLEVGGELWWTWQVPGQRGALTGWVGAWYLKDLGDVGTPPTHWIWLGGAKRLRGVRAGAEIGEVAGLASVEYGYPLLSNLWGLVFLDWGQASDGEFEEWSWSSDKTSLGGRLEWTVVKGWSFYVQVAGSKEGWVTAVGFGRGVASSGGADRGSGQR